MGAPGTGNNSGLAQQQQHMVAMEKLAAAGPSSAVNANAGGSAATTSPSLKKLKREAAQRRKAQARTLKLRAEEQERLQRLEIDVLVEQQRLQRLERQRCEEDARQLKLVGVGTTAANDPASSTHGQQPSLGSLRSMAIHTVHSPLPLPTSATSLSQAYQQQQQLSDHASCNSVPRDSLHSTRLSRGSKIPALAAPGSEHHHIAVVMAGGRHSDQAAETASTVAPNSKLHSGRGSNKDAGVAVGGWRGNKETQRAKQAQQQSMRAAVESRRRLARGPRSGAVIDSHPLLPLEDHRVVSTEYQAAGTQALMRVTLLAAGFVIGARGISARLIGQVTGAIVQSWTESCRLDSIPLRLFRIQGKKGVVQAAATLIEQAVSKYKELCDCKRRGEFVQREHMISGVEFYYQPPPRKAFAINADGCSNLEPPASSTNSTKGGIEATNVDGGCLVDIAAQAAAVAQAQAQLSFTTHHVWLQHLHAQQHDHLVATQSTSHQGQTTMQSHSQGGSSLYSQDGGQKSVLNRSIAMQSRAEGGPQQLGSLFDWHHQPHPQLHRPQTTQVTPVVSRQQPCHHELEVDETLGSGVEFGLSDQGLHQSMASLEQALQQVRLEQRLLQHNRIVGALEMEQKKGNQSLGVATINAPTSTLATLELTSQANSAQLGVSLWSDVLNGHNSNISGSHVSDHGNIGSRGINNGGGIGGFGSGSATFHLGSSLFRIFGNGAHTIPIDVSNQIDCRLETSSNKEGLLSSSASSCGVVAPDTSHFDFQQSDFLQENLPAFPFAMTPSSDVGATSKLSEHSLYGHNQVDSEELCVICLEQPGGVRLMACGHTPFCLNCVQGLINCPLCKERIVGLHHCGNMGNSSRGTSVGLISASNNGGAYRPPIQAKFNGSSYHSWNWVPEASV